MSGQPKLELIAGGRADDVPSPCINVCRMDERSGLCAGCFRTIDEIACWSGYAREDKLAVLAKLEARKRTAG
jgi:predicted Fe-S protein YdhL (DUF1289 family)